MRILLLLIYSLYSYADDLQSLLDYAKENNDLVISKSLIQEAKEREVQARKSDYYPTIDIGASYQSLNERSPFMPGDVYGGYAKVGLDLYDGGKRSSLLNQKKSELKASNFDTEAMKTSISLQIVQDFFTIKSLEASLASRINAQDALQAQLNRMKAFFSAKLATSDDVDRLQSAYDTNVYEIESIKFEILSHMHSLELKVGVKVTSLDESKFQRLHQNDYELVDSIKSLMAQDDAIVNSAESIDSVYYPQLRVEDTYSLYGYDRTDALHPEGAENQNKILLTFNMRLFDMGSIQKQKQAVLLKSQSLQQEIAYKKHEQDIQYSLAKSRINTTESKIKSAKSALISSESAFKTIEEKYNAGIVDNVVYLDALTTQTKAEALYQTSLNDLEIAYAIYYYYAGKEIGELLQ
jgi:outer membrane protein TolC